MRLHSKRPTFKGAWLKHIVTAKDTDGKFSYHLVQIAPDYSIGNHTHEPQLETHDVIKGSGKCVNAGNTIPYEPGTFNTTSYSLYQTVRMSYLHSLISKYFQKNLCEFSLCNS